MKILFSLQFPSDIRKTNTTVLKSRALSSKRTKGKLFVSIVHIWATIHHFEALCAGDQIIARRDPEECLVASHMPSVSKVRVTVGELSAKIQIASVLYSWRICNLKKYFIGMFSQPVESEDKLHSERQQKYLAALMDFVLLQLAVCISGSVKSLY